MHRAVIERICRNVLGQIMRTLSCRIMYWDSGYDIAILPSCSRRSILNIVVVAVVVFVGDISISSFIVHGTIITNPIHVLHDQTGRGCITYKYKR